MTVGFTDVVANLVIRAGVSEPGDGNRAPPQAGIIEGSNPTEYNPKEPIIIFIIQAGIIIIFCRLLHFPLSKLRQPRVIAEVIGGILLGPSVFGRIPGFTESIFPEASMPNLALVANLGLVLFLFLVGLEVDLRFLISNWKIALSVGVGGMLLPFGLGGAVAWGLYKEFAGDEGLEHIDFGTYLLFIGVAMAITAFPVLCRILVDLKLLVTPVGIIVLSAGVGNDVIGWILLALCVALVNSGSGLTAVWVLLTCLGYVLFLVYAVRPVFMWILRKNNALTNGPSQSIVALTLLLTLASAFFTGVIGVHPIFGGFMIGLLCPHEGGFAIQLTEKLEDLISTLFLPLYFALSGLNTNLGLLDSGMVWAYVAAVISVAFFTKFFGAALAARFNGLVWRESFAIGALMSCKGLVELIVLNIGLQAKILSGRTFTVFVVMAVVTTFTTTPLTVMLYPGWYQKKIEAWKRGEIDWDTGAPIARSDDESSGDSLAFDKFQTTKIQRLLVYLRMDNMPALVTLMSMLSGSCPGVVHKTHPSHPTSKDEAFNKNSDPVDTPSSERPPERPVEAYGIRLVELTDRDSSVMKVSEVEEFTVLDPVVNTFRTVGQMNNISVTGEVSVIPESSFAEVLVGKAAEVSSDLILLPWSENGTLSETQLLNAPNPNSTSGKLSSAAYTNFVLNTLDHQPCNSAVFVARRFGGIAIANKDRPKPKYNLSAISFRSTASEAFASVQADQSHHIFMAFFGGEDDRVALRLAIQLAEKEDITATIVHVKFQTSMFDPNERDATFFAAISSSLPSEQMTRVKFDTIVTETPVKDVLARAAEEVGQSPKNAGDMIILGRHALRMQEFSLEKDTDTPHVDARKALGVLGERAVSSGLRASVLVINAKTSS
ncbi:hypothetical protein M501DRAFT_931779 [Patellaria atrata CBS 101060]|uniref:Cation/H+ exchanger transmembrane domain-containing protein n=1 Tax=Patellaria atrata CBS 101060 TaxID=1346257 RepID=A0A9P4SDS3_9PEZI|nr:hypothetical protein M501DRAFT_931779 [Patellaria atrata CBS 101060]